MGIGVLDLNDSNLRLWYEDTTVQSPGYALFQGSEYQFGAPARAAARSATSAALKEAEHKQ